MDELDVLSSADDPHLLLRFRHFVVRTMVAVERMIPMLVLENAGPSQPLVFHPLFRRTTQIGRAVLFPGSRQRRKAIKEAAFQFGTIQARRRRSSRRRSS